MKRLFFVILLLSMVPALEADRRRAMMKQTTDGGGGGGDTYTLLGVTNKLGNATTVTSDQFDSTGAKLISVYVPFFDGDSTPTDSKGNTYVATTGEYSYNGGDTYKGRFWHVINGTVGSGHTITVTCDLPGVNIAWFSYTGSTPSVDTFNGTNGVGAGVIDLQTGYVAPSTSALILSGATWGASDNASGADNGLVILNQQENSSGVISGSLAYTNGTATAVNPMTIIGGSAKAGAGATVVFK